MAWAMSSLRGIVVSGCEPARHVLSTADRGVAAADDAVPVRAPEVPQLVVAGGRLGLLRWRPAALDQVDQES